MPTKDKDHEEPSKKVVEQPPNVGADASSSPSVDVKPELPFDISGIDPNKIKTADALLKGTGFSIKKFVDWANEQHVKTEFIIANMPSKETVKEGINEALTGMVKQAAARQQQILNQGGGQGGQGGGQMGLGQLLGLLGGGGGGVSDEMAKLQTELLRASIDNFKQGAINSKSIVDAVVQSITRKAVSKTLDKITD